MIESHPSWMTVGWIHADKVNADLTSSDVALAIRTVWEAPLKSSALAKRPWVVHDAPSITPAFPVPDASAVVVPAPSPKAQAPTSPGAEGWAAPVEASTTFEYAPRLPLPSAARTR